MFEKGSYVVYKRDVCKVIDIKENKYTGKNCYVLSPILDDSLMINAPVDNKNGFLRNLVTKKEIDKLIKEIPSVSALEIDSHSLENIYRNLFHTGDLKDLITIIKTTYKRNEERKNSNRSIGQKDKEYFEKAEKYLYNEIAVAMNITYEEAKKYVIDRVNENENN